VTHDLRPDEEFARLLDTQDPLARFRDRFAIPRSGDGSPCIYFCGHSLGLQPLSARALVEQEMDDWAALGVAGHFKARRPWYSYHELFRDAGARLVGGHPGEVVMMNGLTVNLHLMLATFYRPTPDRHAILIEEGAFPSDAYAVASQIRHHGLDPGRSLLKVRPRRGETVLDASEIETFLEERGREIAVVLLPGVQYVTGQLFDMERLADAAHRQGCVVGLDLAHAAGNVPLRLHDWRIDFAVWCSYKYLNAGPGAVAGCFVHEDHGTDPNLPRLAGWWGTNPKTRFRMSDEFAPRPGADGWQVSNPPILSLAPLLASLEIFNTAGMEALRARSLRMTGFLEYLVLRIPGDRLRILTPKDPLARGAMLSIRVREKPLELQASLEKAGAVVDFREPDVIRVAPAPLYNTFHEIWRFAGILKSGATGQKP
jgi:kynureninase